MAWVGAYWFMFPISMAIASTSMTLGISGGIFFSPAFLILPSLMDAPTLSPAEAFSAALVTGEHSFHCKSLVCAVLCCYLGSAQLALPEISGFGSGSLAHLMWGEIDWPTAVGFGAIASLAATLGSYLKHQVPEYLLHFVYVVCVLALAGVFWVEQRKSTKREKKRAKREKLEREQIELDTAETEAVELETFGALSQPCTRERGQTNEIALSPDQSGTAAVPESEKETLQEFVRAAQKETEVQVENALLGVFPKSIDKAYAYAEQVGNQQGRNKETRRNTRYWGINSGSDAAIGTKLNAWTGRCFPPVFCAHSEIKQTPESEGHKLSQGGQVSMTRRLVAVLFVLLGGIVTGLVSVGIGEATVTALHLIYYFPLKKAAGTSVTVVLFTAIVASLVSVFMIGISEFPWTLLMFTCPAVFIGAQVGPHMAKRLDPTTGKLAILFIFIIAAGTMLALGILSAVHETQLPTN